MNAAVQTTSPNPPIAILGVPFDNLTPDEALTLVARMIESRRPHHLITASVDILISSQSDAELRRVLFGAQLVLCDGAPLLWASRLLGNPLPGGVAGEDIAPLLVESAEQNGYRLFLLGANPESTERAIAGLRAKHPGLIIAGHYSPPFKQLIEMSHDEVLRHIAAAKPDILFVALGAQQQEKWIAMHYRALGVPVCIGMGSSFDLLTRPAQARTAKRGYDWWRWFFGVWKSPRIPLKHMARDCWVFANGLTRQWWQFQSRAHENWKRASNPGKLSAINWHCVALPSSIDVISLRETNLLEDPALADGRHCLLDASGVESLDSTGVGMLIGLQKRIRATGRQMVLLAPSDQLTQALQLMRLTNFFDAAPNMESAQSLITLRTQERAGAVSPSDDAPNSPLLWQGEITAANAEAVWELTQIHLLKQPGRRELTVDMKAVRFLDTAGAGIMLRTRKFAHHQGIKLKFINVQPEVLNVLRVTRLEEFLLG
ncbi:MAG: hypothetical protein RLY20_2084 [Verrucomicrobiota bacterium]|jgi:N-acetylglucosaminyldiphosphoundecaprenol N-acetyl-beta-D-mannosaminyltransferase